MMAFKAVDEFLKYQNWSNSDARYWNIAVKFLMARKFDVERAVKLYNDHENLRKKEGLESINLEDEEFIKDLESGKFTILPFVKNYPVCALFTVRLHKNNSSGTSELKTLKTLIYQLDAALENPDAQRNGINFIYDMNNCKRSNYDLSLSQKILTLVRGSYPARLNKLFVVEAPFWFKCVVKVLSILMREKIRERVLFVTNEELRNQVAIEILPDYLGGLVNVNHKEWLIECNKLVTNRASTCNSYYYCSSNLYPSLSLISPTTITTITKNGDMSNKLISNDNYYCENNSNKIITYTSNEKKSNRKRQSTDLNDKEIKKQNSNTSSFNEKSEYIFEKIEPITFKNYTESIQNVDMNNDIDLKIDELIEHVKTKGSIGLGEEFKSIIWESSSSQNNLKNRYRDVICLDETRVKLINENKLGQINDFNDMYTNDYIHANYVDGYKQNNAYISTQGPLDETIEDFWVMIWQHYVLSIAMTTKVIEQHKIKCAQYWPLEEGQVLEIQNLFLIKNTNIESLGNYKITKLNITHLPTNRTRFISHCQFLSWPDHGVPRKASHILEFIEIVRKQQKECLKKLNESNQNWNGHPLGPPIVVHCSAGIGRTGTFITIDININRLNDRKTANIKNTVIKMRKQRAQSVQTRDQYVFCYLAILEYAQQNKILINLKMDLNEIFRNLI